MFFLFDKQSEERKKLIISYTEHELSSNTLIGSRAWNLIQSMQRQFVKIKEEGFPKEKTIYDYFPLSEDVDENTRESIVDNLFQAFSQERRERITLYIKGEAKSKSELGNKARSDIQILQKQYRRQVLSLNELEKTIYDAFKDIPEVSFKRKKVIVDYLMAKLPLERRNNLEKYILGEIVQRSEEGKKAKSDLQTMRIRYEKYAKSKLAFRTKYDLFENVKGVTVEEKREIVDNLFRDMRENKREAIEKLLNLEVNSASPQGRLAYNAIMVKQSQYEKYINDRLDFKRMIVSFIREKYGIQIDSRVSFAKIDLLFMAVKVIEYVYRSRSKKTKKEFQNYLEEMIGNIFIDNPNIDFDGLLNSFINVSYEALKEDVLVRL